MFKIMLTNSVFIKKRKKISEKGMLVTRGSTESLLLRPPALSLRDSCHTILYLYYMASDFPILKTNQQSTISTKSQSIGLHKAKIFINVKLSDSSHYHLEL